MLNISVRSRQIAKGSLFPAGLHSVILTNPPAQYRLIKSSGRPSPLTHPPAHPSPVRILCPPGSRSRSGTAARNPRFCIAGQNSVRGLAGFLGWPATVAMVTAAL